MIGSLCGTYVNDGNWDTPDWTEVDALNEFAANAEWEMADVKTRRTFVNEVVKTRLMVESPGNILMSRDDANYLRIAEAAANLYPLDMLILDGKTTEVGARGVRAWFHVSGSNVNQNVDGVMYMGFNLKPAADRAADENPQKAVVEAGPTLAYSDFGETEEA